MLIDLIEFRLKIYFLKMKTKAFAVLLLTPLFSNLFVAAKKGTKMKEDLEGMDYQGSEKSFTS